MEYSSVIIQLSSDSVSQISNIWIEAQESP